MKALIAGLLALSFALPARGEVNIQEVTSPGGLTAWLVEEHSIPFVALELHFKGGTSLEPQDKRGVVNLMMALLEEGAGDLDARGFARARETLAAGFEYDANADSVSISARFLSENRDQALDLLRQSLIAPSFPQDALDRVREQVEAGLRADLKDPEEIARQQMNLLAFGDHPYGGSGDGTLETVARLTRDDIVAAHHGALARDQLFISAVGDITADELGPVVDRLTAGLPQTGWTMPEKTAFSTAGGVTVVPYETPQSVAVFAQPGIGMDHPDFFSAYVLNTVLGGGGVESRLMTEVREKRGLTYGVYSYLVARDHADMILGQVASANDRIAEAIDVIRAEWSRISQNGITPQELSDAKTYLTGAYPLRFDGNGQIARILVSMQMDGFPIDYIRDRNARVEAVSLEDVNQVARDLLDPTALHFVVVGQPEGLDPQ